MASMYQRDGIWYCKYFENGKRRRVSLRTKSVQRARAKVVEIENSLEVGRPVGHKKDMAIDEFTVAYLKEIEATKRPHTVKTITHEWKHYRLWAKPARLSEITPEKVAQYKRHLLEQGKANSTVRSSLLCLSSVFKTAIKEMHVFEGDNPVKGVGLPTPDEAFPRYMELNEIDGLINCAIDHSRDMHLLVALGVYAGLRKNELVNTLWSWMDFKGRGRILIQSDGQFKTKSGKPRATPMASRLREILETVPKSERKGYILYPEMPEKENGTSYRVDLAEAFNTICYAAGLSWVTPHKMRHTFASQRAIAGVSLYKIGEWMGHADPKTTKIYAHLAPDDDDIDRVQSKEGSQS